ncbi:MAG TPA: hypothetical protein ENK31_07805, partial [Nannocystis exedens]|nr:hypothetical protein [Nannocystis exedens]
MEGQPSRIIVVNFSPEARGLVAAVLDFFADGSSDRDVEITCTGVGKPAPAEAALATVEGVCARYIEGSVSLGVDRFAELLLAEKVAVADADAVIVLPHRASAEVDAHSRLTCVALRKACGRRELPTTVVAIEDPEASFEFSGLGVTTIFYPGFLRAALFAHACVDLPVFHFILALLRGHYCVRTLAIPEELCGRTFGEACLTLERDAAGMPISLVGVFLEDPEGGVPIMKVNPGPRFS